MADIHNKPPGLNASHPQDLVTEGNDTHQDAVQEITTSEASYTQEENLGEQDIVGGSAPVTGVDSDVGEMAKQVGLDYDTDNNGDGYENDELNIAEKINQAEQSQRDN